MRKRNLLKFFIINMVNNIFNFIKGGNMKKFVICFLPLFFIFAQLRTEEKDPREIIEKVRIYKLTEELDLSEEQTIKFFPKLKEMRRNEQEFHIQRIEMIKKLKELLEEKANEQEIVKVLNKLQELQKKRFESQLKEIEEIKQILTPEQQARFIIFQEEFEREIRDLIREVRGRRQLPPPER
uniref:Periplasmic heavy metal sensor n=1 Tax=candidate division WOR-3 bacterium TaxID=2052148 RepID=A0A7C6EME5_UNCW3